MLLTMDLTFCRWLSFVQSRKSVAFPRSVSLPSWTISLTLLKYLVKVASPCSIVGSLMLNEIPLGERPVFLNSVGGLCREHTIGLSPMSRPVSIQRDCGPFICSSYLADADCAQMRTSSPWRQSRRKPDVCVLNSRSICAIMRDTAQLRSILQ